MSKSSFVDIEIVATMLERSPAVPKAAEIISELASPMSEVPSITFNSNPSNCLNLMFNTPETASDP